MLVVNPNGQGKSYFDPLESAVICWNLVLEYHAGTTGIKEQKPCHVSLGASSISCRLGALERGAHEGERYKAPNTFDTKTQARAWLSTQRTAIIEGRWVDPSKPIERVTIPTLGSMQSGGSLTAPIGEGSLSQHAPVRNTSDT